MLSHRKILRVTGADAKSFLQGLFTNDLRPFYSNDDASSSTAAVFGGFLNGNGRVVTDAILFPVPPLTASGAAAAAARAGGALKDGDILAEVDAAHAEQLIQHLIAFKLRAQVAIEPVDHLAVRYDIVSQESSSSSSPSSSTQLNNQTAMLFASFMDPRLGLSLVDEATQQRTGLRRQIVVLPPNGSGADAAATAAISASVARDYCVFMYERGICEGKALWDHMRLPFEGNLDIVGGIHYDKGCYIGQELVQRQKTQLVTKKRLVPFTTRGAMLQPGEDIFSQQSASGTPSPMGKIVACVQKGDSNDFVGVASVRMEAMDPETLEANLVSQSHQQRLCATIPFWWPDQEIDKCLPIKE